MCYLDSLIGGLNAIIWLKSHPNSHGNACQQAIWHSCKTFDKICNVFGGTLIECKNLQGIWENEMPAF